jgi:hypothetical protein
MPGFIKLLTTILILSIIVTISSCSDGSGSSDGSPTTYYQDSDGDGYGNSAVSQEATSRPTGYVTDSTDCDDGDASVNPGAPEICEDGTDNNCNNQIDELCIQVPIDYNTIQEAINVSSSGTTITVSNGIYYENINFKGRRIILKSANGPEDTIIDGAGAGAVVTFNSRESSDSVIDGFTIINGTGTSRYSDFTYGGGIDCYNSSSPTIKNCFIYNNSATGYGGGICCWRDSSPIIENCKIDNNSAITYNGGGIFISGNRKSSPKIINCLITNNTAGTSGGGICYAGGDSLISNCTISGNEAEKGAGGGIYGENESTATIINSIVWDNTAGHRDNEIGLLYEKSAPTVTFSNILGGYDGEGNIDEDPLFVNAAGGDYHLQLGSPCIDTGIATGAPSYDIDGDLRPQGLGYDMGVYEY